MVGDVKQSIYRFRQARPELFIEKYDKYKLEERDIKTGEKYNYLRILEVEKYIRYNK